MTAAAAGVVVSLVSAAASIYQGFSSSDSGDEAKELAEHNARMAEMEAQESARILERKTKSQEDLDRARAAASGLGGESVEGKLSDAEAENRRQIAWTRKAGASQAAASRMAGSQAASQAQSQAFGHLASGLTSGIQGISGIYTNW